jgi:hypothetical protein
MGRGTAKIAATICTTVVLWSPSVARACAVCTAGRDEENAFAFLMTTLFLSVMPLAALGTLIFVLWRRTQKLERERAEADARGISDPGPGVAEGAGSPGVLGVPSR